MKADELREKYLAFFETKGCVRRPSDVLVPTWDPSVLFTPAGMNQFKDHFLGKVKLEFTRATSCQKCLRTGDIENVGKTPYHHTFFEMLGNFSFGDYFKREAINWAWEFLTSKKWLGLEPDRLSATVYLDDEEAATIWSQDVGLPPERITRCGEEENFWPANAPSQGPDGVCGPCSEIYYQAPGGGNVEIWNLVFTQFNRVGPPPDNLRPLPSKNIDTGMGLERTAAALQGVDSNFHIDIIKPLVLAAADVCGLDYDPAGDAGRRLRRITDHVRACTFAIHENVVPGAVKEKYVIRRLLRRAVLDGHQLGRREPFLHQLVPAVVVAMKVSYPELGKTAARVADIIRQEEASFFDKIDAGLERIGRLFEQMEKEGRAMVPGARAAELYQTHGFPPELLETLAAERNLTFDWPGFRKAMEAHGAESGGGKKVEVFGTGPLDILKRTLHTTDFLGYETTEATAKVRGIVAQNQACEELREVGHEQPVTVVLDRTPFYGESGGQVGDSGELLGDGFQFHVIDTQRDGELVLHLGHLRSGVLRLGATVTARVDAARRQGIRRAHSATHLLHYALQKHLGSFAQQQGSKVDDDWLRFDFANPRSVTPDQLQAIEDEINQRIMSGAAVAWKRMPIAEARKTGAMMLFGEKYPDIVRVVSMGDFSRELCGGTHLDNTGQVGLFKLLSEGGVSAGVRRITALTGRKALEHVRRNEAALDELSGALKVPPAVVPARVGELMKEVRDLRKQLEAKPKEGGLTADKLLEGSFEVGGSRVVVAEIPGGTAPSLRQQIDQLRQKAGPVAVMLGSRQEDKVLLVAGISRDLQQKGLDAVKWIRSAAEIVGGSGGGRPDMAQAGGKHPEKLPSALDEARQSIKKLLA